MWRKLIYDKNRFLSHKLVSEKETCDGNLFLWQKQKLVTVTETCSFFTEAYFCDRNLLLWWKLISVTESCFFEKKIFLWQKLISVTQTYLWQKLISVTENNFFYKTCFSDRNLFLWETFFQFARNIFLSKIHIIRLLTREFRGKVSVRNGSFRYLR